MKLLWKHYWHAWGLLCCQRSIQFFTACFGNCKSHCACVNELDLTSAVGEIIWIIHNIVIYRPSASRTHKFVGLCRKTRSFLQLWKKRRRFKPLYWYQPWIYRSQYPSCLYLHPAGFGWQFSQERARCSWNMSDNIKCDHSQSGVVEWFFPKNHP